MKARVKETGEIIAVTSLYLSMFLRLDDNGNVIGEYDEDEVEILPGPNANKMVSLNEVCEYLKGLKCQEYAGGPYVEVLTTTEIENLRKHFINKNTLAKNE